MPFLIQGHITILQRIIRYNNLDTSFDSVGERIKRRVVCAAYIINDILTNQKLRMLDYRFITFLTRL